MSGTIVVSCFGDGSVETLLKDGVFDTRAVFGATSRKVERVSEILPTGDGMRFFIRWLRGPLAGTDGAETFPTYEAAVEAEVAAINAARLAGISFASGRGGADRDQGTEFRRTTEAKIRAYPV